MNELKYCKFCDKEKPIKEFCKSGGFVKNICKKCQNKKQKQIYANAKKVNEKDNIIDNLQSKIDKAIEYLYEHSQYNDRDGVHYIKEDEYCVDYLLDILKGEVK